MTDKYLGDNLIFIISQPRSGSTLLQRILSGHPDIGASAEPWFLIHQAYARTHIGITTDYSADWSALGINEFVRHYTDGDAVYDDAVRAFAKTLYGNVMQRQGVTRFIDKTPRYVMIVPDLIRWFPQAKFIFLKRNPLSVLASIVNTQIQNDLTTLERFNPELLEGPEAILRGIEALGDRAIEVSYEDFVTDPDADLQTICAALGIDYHPDLADYGDSPELKGFMQDRTGVTRHSRPEKTRAHGWKQMLRDPQQLEFARGYLAHLDADVVNRLSYDYDELVDAVREASRRHPAKGNILSWRVAIATQQAKRGADQFEMFRYRAIRDRGPVVGRVQTIGRYLKGIAQLFRYIFGRAKLNEENIRKRSLEQLAGIEKK